MRSQGCGELKRQLSKVQMLSGDRMKEHQTDERLERPTGVMDAGSGRVLRGREGCKLPS